MIRNNVESIILDRLKELDTKIDKLHDKLDQNNVDIAQLKVKTSIWGGIAGGISGLLVGLSAIFVGNK